MPILDQHGRPLPTTSQLRAAANLRARRAALNAAYDAAQTTPENARHWRYTDLNSAAVANSAHVRQTLRARARYEAANNSFAHGIIDTIANDAIGRGPRLQILTDNPAANQQIEAAWNAWSADRDLAAKLRTARKARCVDGEAFIQLTDNPRARTPVTLDVRLVESDQIEDPWDTLTNPSHVSGVHFDRYGNPTAYDKLDQHPGDVYGTQLKATPISADVLIHWYRCDRPGQIRGIPEITPALPLFAQLRRYTLAVLLAAETAADFAAVLETAAAPFDEDGNPDIAAIDEFDQVSIDRGTMTSLPRGWRMSQFKPEQPVTSYKEFRDALLNEIARCLNMPANKARADSSGYNYASGRLDHGTYYEAIDVDRDAAALNVLDRIFSAFFAEAILVPGLLPSLPSFPLGRLPHRWYWDGHKHADPAKEANAAATLHGLGLLTDEAYLLREGIDPEEHFEQLERQRARRARLGLPMTATAAPPEEAPEPEDAAA